MNTWVNPSIILKYTPTAKTAIAIRAEYYDDKNGVIIATGTPNGFKTWGFSTNFDYNIANNIVWRVEASSLSGYPLILPATWYCRVDLIVIS